MVPMETMEWVGQIVARLLSTESGRGTVLRYVLLLMRGWVVYMCVCVCVCVRNEEMLSLVAGFTSLCLTSDTPPVTPIVMTTWLFYMPTTLQEWGGVCRHGEVSDS